MESPHNDFRVSGESLSNRPGMIYFNVSHSRTPKGLKTVHFDIYGDHQFGHIYAGDLDNLIKWLKSAQKWIKK